ncbi:MAG: hypothetical protein K9H16_01610, partial [Bacteroidales bacterium]|nr:hypothetical protein [Bacteroidales bacterium]
HIMHLRSASQLKKIYLPTFKNIKLYPLLAICPPYQTNYKPVSKLLDVLRKAEKSVIEIKSFSNIADQIVTVCSKYK